MYNIVTELLKFIKTTSNNDILLKMLTSFMILEYMVKR